jgi:RimJ/RimL family protein N-acetyltransferase
MTIALDGAPTLQTERLTLRPHRRDDFDDLARMWADPEVVRFIGGQPSTREASWSRLHRYVGHWAIVGYGYWALEDRATGRFAGEAGFADFHRDLQPPFDGTPESGWVLAPWAHGRGLATEAMLAIVAWGDAHLAHATTACLIHPAHTASIRVATKVGYARAADRVFRGESCAVFERASGGAVG